MSMKSNSAFQRLQAEYRRLLKDPISYLTAQPLSSNLLEWRYVIRGPKDTPYEDGIYQGKIIFPLDYPFKPPNIYMLTPNGRFKTDTSLCLTITAYHPDSWNPAWSISSILNGFLSFMCDTSSTHGSIETTYAQKRKFAHDSLAFNIQDPVFCELFPEITEEIKQTLSERARKTSSTDSSLDHSGHQQTSNTSTTNSTNSFINMSVHTNVLGPLPHPTGPDPYSSLKNFDVLKTLGRGHFSVVYSARNRFNGDFVALKKVELSRMADAKAIDDCKREIALLQQLNHPNVIKYISHFVDENDLYIVLELASAGDLAKMIKHFNRTNKLMPEKTIWKFFSQICSGLEHMHSKRIMHRDIKPANIFVSAEGIVRLGDLGLGRFFGSKTTSAHSMVGTPYYMSPERIHEHDLGYDFRSDIWSLGCILYEMAALRSPFYGENLNLILLRQKIEALDYTPLPTNFYSSELRLLVSKCLVLEPEQRPDITEVNRIAQMMYTRFTASSNNTPTPTPPSHNDSAFGNVTPVNNQ
ncbi:unnamed protein product [Adineta ricciae]|uniref:Ubiquitin-conjugating enzyme E2 J2 n=1 Tax=Adineta ricciae TaxID=249248 RepID=A0A814HI26_ADIRI|nr:unnamed protein product [Adineta ricciae]